MCTVMKTSLALAISFLALSAKAETVEVVQVNQTFMTGEAKAATVKIKKGDKIKFKNSDKVTHNVFAESSFDLKAQPPGDERTQSFEDEGKFTIRCAIHPKMKFNVEVGK